MTSSGPIVVVGSINMDLVCRTPHMPRPGETVGGGDFRTIPGGKGANQAVAAAKLGGNVHLVGRVGGDDFGQRLLDGLLKHKVNTEHVTITEGVASGCAMIMVDKKGENSIVLAPGANARVGVEDVDQAENLIRTASVVVMQLEIPLPTVRHVIGLCQKYNVYSILDPAPIPARPLPRAFYGVDVFTPNESEAEILLRLPPTNKVQRKKPEDPRQIASRLLARGARAVVLKQGGRGATMMNRDGLIQTIKPYKVKVVDTTAAGDAFTAALAVARAEGMDLVNAIRFANAAGAICCQTFGAQPALPSREEVETLVG